MQADVNTSDAKRILGPIGSTDCLYVNDCFLTLAIDGNFILGDNSKSESGYNKRSNNESGTDFWLLKIEKDS